MIIFAVRLNRAGGVVTPPYQDMAFGALLTQRRSLSSSLQGKSNHETYYAWLIFRDTAAIPMSTECLIRILSVKSQQIFIAPMGVCLFGSVRGDMTAQSHDKRL
jgi:hypothetical protein